MRPPQARAIGGYLNCAGIDLTLDAGSVKILDVQGVRVAALAVVAAWMTSTTPSATGAPSASRVSPETFARVASGVALIRSAPDCEGKTRPGYGTGFLVGSRVIVTATHGVGLSEKLRACLIQVRLSGRWYDASFVKAWYDDDATIRNVDLATLKLTRPAPGHLFEIASSIPARGSTVATIGHPFGLPLSFHQGVLRRAVVSDGVPTVIAHMVAEGGNSGGPIINRNGEVIGVLQRPAVPDEDPVQGLQLAAGLNFTSWFVGRKDDLCRAYPQGGIPDCPTNPREPPRRKWVTLRAPPR